MIYPATRQSHTIRDFATCSLGAHSSSTPSFTECPRALRQNQETRCTRSQADLVSRVPAEARPKTPPRPAPVHDLDRER
eukprot:6230015-Pyramimonas_sp.AAC.1